MKILSDDIFDLEFNNWLKQNGVFLAIGIAAIILIIVVTIFLLSKKKNR